MRMKTVRAVLNSYRTLSIESLLEPLADNFTYRILPQSLSMPKRDKKAFASHAAQIYLIFTSFAMKPQSVFEDRKNNVVFIYAKMVGELKSLGSWENEALLMMRMFEDRTKAVIYLDWREHSRQLDPKWRASLYR